MCSSVTITKIGCPGTELGICHCLIKCDNADERIIKLQEDFWGFSCEKAELKACYHHLNNILENLHVIARLETSISQAIITTS